MKCRSVFKVVGHQWDSKKKTPVVLIEDLNGRVSVTNDAEAVVKELLQEGYSDYRIVYKDSTGHWDELCHNGSEFTGFGSISDELQSFSCFL